MSRVKTPWDLRNIYLYLVCFVCVIMILVGTVTALNSIIDLIYPDPPYYGGADWMMRDYAEFEKINKDTNQSMTFEEYKQMREAQWQEEALRQNAYRKKGIAKSFSVIIVAIPFYLYHWRKIEKEKLE